MTDICSKCGLPKDLCVCGTIAKEQEKVRIYMIKKGFGKKMTIVEGISKELEPKEILKELKTRLACGGTVKNGVIELQGEHIKKAKDALVKLGFPPEQMVTG
jgi:translation initiation factor 1